ncbi:polyprenyl diphosphate synthase [Derxia gummosa]|uniref:Isoprenyl transferase n=1 Tax=Derxia gummosa DSM 723 TaxID=1121388 RepID=A0A8B6X9E2_9BURK|nr:polyprenyl diphosphate synthase [Derxia gummosa]
MKALRRLTGSRNAAISDASAGAPASVVPRHVAIIMDGNGRWATRRLLPRTVGHHKGVDAVRTTVEACVQRGIEYLTLFAFSSENWRRPEEEVSVLMTLFVSALEREVGRLTRTGVRLKVIGDVSAFNPTLQAAIRDAEARTAGNDKLTLTVAANYGGRWDVAQAMRRLLAEQPECMTDPALITPEAIDARLATAGMPEPDLFIRTGGEQRISNFLLWQLAYTELYFTDDFWPDFDAAALDRAIASFSERERRFGRTSAQVAATATAQRG